MRDLYWWEWLLIGIALVYAIFIIFYMRNLVQNKLKFLVDNCDESKVNENFRPFVRTDRKKWSMCEIYFCAVFLLPIRVVLLLFTSISISLISCFCTCQKKGVDNTHVEQSACKRNSFSLILRLTIRFAMLCLGVWWIPKKMKKIQDYDTDYPIEKYKDRKDKTTMIVGNHIGYIEAVYFATTKYCPSFVAKKAVSKLPFLGGLGKTMQCIFVDRNDNLARNAVLESIEKRCRLIKEGKRFPPLAMFPEGTCSNGNYILSFKKGAFEPFSPIKIFYFKFIDRHFNNYFDSLPIGTHLLLTMCQLANVFEVTEFDTYYPDHLNLKNPEDWKIYSEKIRNIMIKCGNVKASNSGYRDCQAYEQFLRTQKVQIKQDSQSVQLHRNFSRGLTIADREDAMQKDVNNMENDQELMVVQEKKEENLANSRAVEEEKQTKQNDQQDIKGTEQIQLVQKDNNDKQQFDECEVTSNEPNTQLQQQNNKQYNPKSNNKTLQQ